MKTRDTKDSAIRLFETFNARGHKKVTEFPFSWPTKVQRVGAATAELYRSNKWKRDLTEFEDYKHIVESEQSCYVVPGFLRLRSGKSPLPVRGKTVKVSEVIGDPAPQHFAVLAPLLAVQLRLDAEGGEQGELYEVTVSHAHLGAARVIETGKAFLFVYSQAGVHMLIAGGNLGVETDGIVG